MLAFQLSADKLDGAFPSRFGFIWPQDSFPLHLGPFYMNCGPVKTLAFPDHLICLLICIKTKTYGNKCMYWSPVTQWCFFNAAWGFKDPRASNIEFQPCLLCSDPDPEYFDDIMDFRCNIWSLPSLTLRDPSTDPSIHDCLFMFRPQRQQPKQGGPGPASCSPARAVLEKLVLDLLWLVLDVLGGLPGEFCCCCCFNADALMHFFEEFYSCFWNFRTWKGTRPTYWLNYYPTRKHETSGIFHYISSIYDDQEKNPPGIF